jgi:hypothetical protein
MNFCQKKIKKLVLHHSFEIEVYKKWSWRRGLVVSSTLAELRVVRSNPPRHRVVVFIKLAPVRRTPCGRWCTCGPPGSWAGSGTHREPAATIRLHISVTGKLKNWTPSKKKFQNFTNLGSMLWLQFSESFDNFGEKMAFFSKTNVMVNILHKLALFWVKNANFFAEKFCENI